MVLGSSPSAGAIFFAPSDIFAFLMFLCARVALFFFREAGICLPENGILTTNLINIIYSAKILSGKVCYTEKFEEEKVNVSYAGNLEFGKE